MSGRLRKNCNEEKLNPQLRYIVLEAMAKSFTPNQIEKAFEVPGILPFNEILLINCRI